jgi:type II secretory pathway component PulF
MTKEFLYRAASPQGRILEGRVRSASRAEALEDLRRKELYPITIAVDTGKIAVAQKSGAKRNDAVRLWTRTMATMLEAGVSLERALAFSSAESRNKEVSASVSAIRGDVHQGTALAASMRKFPRLFGPVDTGIVAAGEETGTLASALGRLASYQEESAELQGKVRSALTYPAVMTFVTSMGLVIMTVFVIPRLASMLQDSGGTLPVSTIVLLAVSHAVAAWWPAMLALIALAGWEFQRWSRIPSNRMKWHEFRLRIPVTGDLEREFAAARFTRTFSVLLSSGSSILSALRIARATVSNAFIAAAITRAEGQVGEGRRLSVELAGVLPARAVQLLAVGEESGKLAQLSEKAAESYEKELARRLRAAIGLIEPALVIFFGAIIGFVAIAMLQAIYSINGHLT